MDNEIIYPRSDVIIKYNLLVLTLIKVKKADKAKVLSHQKIDDAINDAKKLEGDVYDKAACLLKGLIKNHAFASGNRRTAFMTVKDFLITNKKRFAIPDDPKYAKVMVGIREGYYTNQEIKEWIQNGQIKEFKR